MREFFRNFIRSTKTSNKIFGDIGEDIAERYLISQNYKIRARNFTCSQGEIDIIAQHNNIIAFVEVKARSTLSYGLPEEAVNHTKRRHICKAAKYYISKNAPEHFSYRADIIAIIMNDKAAPDIKHFTDAFPLR